MNRDEIRMHFYEGNAIFVRNRDGVLFVMIGINHIMGYIIFSKLKGTRLGRQRILDIISFSKSYKVYKEDVCHLQSTKSSLTSIEKEQ